MRRCVIVGGAEIRTYDRVRQYFRPDDFFIYCDCGLRHQEALRAEPDLIVGDFDSHEKPETDRETIVLPVKKDDTDTVFAAKEAMRRGFDEFLLVGVSGGRLDHTLANVQNAANAAAQGTSVTILDEGSEISFLTHGTLRLKKRPGWGLSVFSLSDASTGVCLRGVKYELENAALDNRFPLGVSNEFDAPEAEITVEQGVLMVMQTKKQ